MMRRVLLSWSSGKDSAWALHVLRAVPDVQLTGLLTTLNVTSNRVSMHATRIEIVEAQARSLGLPLRTIPLPQPCSNEVYEEAMCQAIKDAIRDGVTHLAFGDLLLEDIRAYRIRQLEGTGLAPLFPLWQEPTKLLARRMVEAGLKAVVTCVDLKRLPRSFVGRMFDHMFLDELPTGVDPCGENGEFHTCVLDGPMFADPIPAVMGDVVERDGFCFADLVPKGA
ncbi:MAG: adenine nucleotide alpha hydrolase [Nitrospira sp.]|nr:adenine nucleotide alpha hydrolase [Nitrospira sp.]MCP9441823.1 adenine nucleotide alpha hydrolase [Nitrospira sp.]